MSRIVSVRRSPNVLQLFRGAVICSWCGVVMVQGDLDTVSHGICQACAAKMEAE